MSENEVDDDPSQGLYLGVFLVAFAALIVTMLWVPLW
jgi:hypothetical protein